MNEIAKALVKFQKEVKNPVKDATNPHFKSKYVKLDGLLEVIKEPLANNGLCLLQRFENIDSVTNLTTVLLHESGELISSSIPISPDKSNIQGVGSAITYLRRYSIEVLCGICGTDDDDGNESVMSGQSYKQVSKPAKAQIIKSERNLIVPTGPYKGKLMSSFGKDELISICKYMSNGEEQTEQVKTFLNAARDKVRRM